MATQMKTHKLVRIVDLEEMGATLKDTQEAGRVVRTVIKVKEVFVEIKMVVEGNRVPKIVEMITKVIPAVDHQVSVDLDTRISEHFLRP